MRHHEGFITVLATVKVNVSSIDDNDLLEKMNNIDFELEDFEFEQLLTNENGLGLKGNGKYKSINELGDLATEYEEEE